MRIARVITTPWVALAVACLVAPAAGAESHSAGTGRQATQQAHLGMDTADRHVVQPGDTLSQIAQDYLGAKELWPHIAEANGIDDPKALEVGRELRIPKRKRQWLAETE